MRKLGIGRHVIILDGGTGEFTNCVGRVSCYDEDSSAPIGVAFGKASNTIPLGNRKWGAWFSRDEIKPTKKDVSPICPTPID